MKNDTPIIDLFNDEKTALFIDGANLHSSLRNLDCEIDYRKLLVFFKQKSRLIRSFYYATIIEDDNNVAPLRPLFDWMDYNGYTMVLKKHKHYFENSITDKRINKPTMDLEIAIDMMEMATKLDHAILFSGDGDFVRLVAAVQKLGVRVTVVSTMRSNPIMISDELRRQADNFIELADILPFLTRDSKPKYDKHDDSGNYSDDFKRPNNAKRPNNYSGARRDERNSDYTTIYGENDY